MICTFFGMLFAHFTSKLNVCTFCTWLMYFFFFFFFFFYRFAHFVGEMFVQMWLFAHLWAKCLHKCGCLHICGRNVCTNVGVCTFEGFCTFHGATRATPFITGLLPGLPSRVPSPQWLWQARELGTSDGACGTPTLFMTGPRSRHQQRCVRDATDFEFSFLFTVKQQKDRVYPRCEILQQGMHMNFSSKVYCDRVYFLCAERFETGSGFDPPPPPRAPPPPPRGPGSA